MIKPKADLNITNPKSLKLPEIVGQTTAQAISVAALAPEVNAATVVASYQKNILGDGADLNALILGLKQSMEKANAGDLSSLEGMLIGQATALQTIFTNLAKRAVIQTQLNQYETFLGLALKAQSQSRATISALADLKHPRQATFVQQANIANGPQQVNNGGTQGRVKQSDGEKSVPQQNRLLEDHHGGTYLDSGTAATATRSSPAVETVEAVHRAYKRRG